MQPPEVFTRIVDRKRFSVKTATLLAHDAYWDGHNWERRGTNTFLYRTPRGGFFKVFLSQWQGAKDTLEPVSEGEAIEMYENYLTEHEVPYEEAFPGVTIEEA